MSCLSENASVLLAELEERLNAIALETDDPLRQPELSIESIQKSLSRLKELVYSYTFGNQDEEIYFFKCTKPSFFSKLIYHVKVYNIEMHKPHGSDKAKRKYLLNELYNIESFIWKYAIGFISPLACL
jgi:RteC protein